MSLDMLMSSYTGMIDWCIPNLQMMFRIEGRGISYVAPGSVQDNFLIYMKFTKDAAEFITQLINY